MGLLDPGINGQLSGYEEWATGRFLPVGSTDSELAFCWLLNQLELAFPTPPQDMRAVFTLVARCCDRLATLGVFNMLLTDGDYVMTYCTSNLHWLTRRALLWPSPLAG